MSTRRALAFSFLDRYAGLVLSVLSSMVIARLLTPAEIGVFSVTMVLLSFVSGLRDMGAGQYLLQEKELTTDRIRATWAVQLGLGLSFAALVLAAAYPAALFYKEPRMLDLMMVLALNFAVSPFGSLTYAWLMREMRFDRLAAMRFISTLTSACVSVTLAWRGHGPISLAIGSLCGTLANALLGVRFRPRDFPWMPGLAEARRVLSFGGRISLTSIVNTLGAGAPELLLSKLQGLSASGLYSRSYGLASMFHKLVMDAVLSVAMPLFSKANRQQEGLETPFLSVVSYVTVIGWPFMAMLAIYAHPITRLLYGPQWDESVPVTRFLAAGMAFILPGAICIAAVNACGAAHRLLRTTLLTVAIEIPIIAIGASFGLTQAGVAFAAAMLVSSVLWLESARHVLSFRWSGLLRVAGSSVLVMLGTSALPLLVAQGMPDSGPAEITRLIVGVPVGIACLVGMLFATRHPATQELQRALHKLHWRHRDA